MSATPPADRAAIDQLLHEQIEQIDELIEKVETRLPQIRKMCKKQTKQKKSPTDRISPEAKMRLKELSEDPILNDDGSDIRTDEFQKINGFHPNGTNGTSHDS